MESRVPPVVFVVRPPETNRALHDLLLFFCDHHPHYRVSPLEDFLKTDFVDASSLQPYLDDSKEPNPLVLYRTKESTVLDWLVSSVGKKSIDEIHIIWPSEVTTVYGSINDLWIQSETSILHCSDTVRLYSSYRGGAVVSLP